MVEFLITSFFAIFYIIKMLYNKEIILNLNPTTYSTTQMLIERSGVSHKYHYKIRQSEINNF